MEPNTIPTAERRKQVKLRKRPDLIHVEQRYEGRLCTVVKDPVNLKYYRFNDQENFVFQRLDGKHTLEEIRTDFESAFRPNRLGLEDLEFFARQLVTSGLVQHESENATRHLFQERKKQRFKKKLATFTNILYIKIPIIDPDHLLTWMLKYTSWIYTLWFMTLSVMLMLFAVGLVTLKFNTFYAQLPSFNQFFQFYTLLYMWIALGIVKVIHEFGHGLTCKAFGGEVHEMGALLMCFSPALYCNVTDAWTMADKWKRILISFAGIYVELIIAAIATLVWWNTKAYPFVNNVSLCLMTLCSVSTFVFNANPLMRFDGYYILADWMEVPNLRERANRYITSNFQETCLGMEVQPEQYMAAWRKVLFVLYAITSYIYRWVVTFSILYFLSGWLKPYKLESVSMLLTVAAIGSMFVWPMYRMVRSVRQRGRMPDMKRNRVVATLAVAAALLAAFFLLPLPVSRIHETGLVQLQEKQIDRVYISDPGFLVSRLVEDGQTVREGQLIATFSNPRYNRELARLTSQVEQYQTTVNALTGALSNIQTDTENRNQIQRDLADARGKLEAARSQQRLVSERIGMMNEIKAPRGGTVMSLPHKDEVGKLFEREEPMRPFCSVGDPLKSRIVVPVGSLDYNLLKENLASRKELAVSIHLPGRTDRVYQGRITSLPETDVHDVPVGLTHSGGGSLATKPNQDPNRHEPLVQTYLVTVDILDPDETIRPGTLATVKIHNGWRTAAWWAYRNIASALELGLI